MVLRKRRPPTAVVALVLRRAAGDGDWAGSRDPAVRHLQHLRTSDEAVQNNAGRRGGAGIAAAKAAISI